MRFAVALLVALVAIPTVAFADDVNVARKHYERGTALYDLQRYSEAAAEYEAAFDAKNDPAFLFNIGQAYRFAKEYEKSIRSFKAFLRRTPETSMRPQIEIWLAEMQTALDARARDNSLPAPRPSPVVTPSATTPNATESPAAALPTDRPRHGRALLIGGFTAAGIGLASLGAGIGFGVAARGPYDELNSPKPGYVFDATTQDALHRDQALEVSLIAVGSVLVVGGVVVGVVGLRRQHEEHAARPSLLAEVR